RRLHELDRRAVPGQGVDLRLRRLPAERRDAAPEAEAGPQQLPAVEVLEQRIGQLGGLRRDLRQMVAAGGELAAGDLRDPVDEPSVEVVEVLTGSRCISGGHRAGSFLADPTILPCPAESPARAAPGGVRLVLHTRRPSPPRAAPPRCAARPVRVRGMTTNTTPADHGRHLLSGDDAAE